LNKIKSSLNPHLEIEGVVLTMFDVRVSLGHQVKSEIEKYFGDTFFKTAIPRSVRLAEAPSFGQSIFEYDPTSKGAEAYLSLADEILSKRGFHSITGGN
jgi:chromosome partitioning protein